MKRHALNTTLLSLALASAGGQADAAPPSRAELARQAADLMARNYRAEAPGAAILVARGDTILFRAARGEADIEHHVPLRPDSVFRIGSVTKQFVAAGLLRLVEAGRVRLDDPLSNYLPDYPGGDRITLLQLLNHTAGVTNYTALPGYMEGAMRQDMSTAQMIGLFSQAQPDFAPGENWAYSNSGYVLAGAVIEAVTGKPWHVYLDETFFRPLGMRHTGYGHDPRFADRQVHGYSYEEDRVVATPPISMTQPHAAGALVSTVDDLLRWNRGLHEGRVLRGTTYRQMITPVGRAAAPGIRYGFGLYRDHVRSAEALRHGGHIAGFTAAMNYLPGPDITVVVLENDDVPNGPDPADALARRLAAMALGEPYPAMRPMPVAPDVLEAAQGVYRFDDEVTRTLRVVDGRLTAQRGNGPRVALTPIAADDFLYEDGFNRLKLERDGAGNVTAMRLFANGDGAGEVGARTSETPSATVAMQLPRASLERLVGAYAARGMTFQVFLEGDALKGQIAGQPPVSLLAASATRFDVAETGASVEFVLGEGDASQVTIRQRGRELTLQRAP